MLAGPALADVTLPEAAATAAEFLTVRPALRLKLTSSG